MWGYGARSTWIYFKSKQIPVFFFVPDLACVIGPLFVCLSFIWCSRWNFPRCVLTWFALFFPGGGCDFCRTINRKISLEITAFITISDVFSILFFFGMMIHLTHIFKRGYSQWFKNFTKTTLWKTNMTMENHNVSWEVHYKWWFSIVMLNYQRVIWAVFKVALVVWCLVPGL